MNYWKTARNSGNLFWSHEHIHEVSYRVSPHLRQNAVGPSSLSEKS